MEPRTCSTSPTVIWCARLRPTRLRAATASVFPSPCPARRSSSARRARSTSRSRRPATWRTPVRSAASSNLEFLSLSNNQVDRVEPLVDLDKLGARSTSTATRSATSAPWWVSRSSTTATRDSPPRAAGLRTSSRSARLPGRLSVHPQCRIDQPRAANGGMGVHGPRPGFLRRIRNLAREREPRERRAVFDLRRRRHDGAGDRAGQSEARTFRQCAGRRRVAEPRCRRQHHGHLARPAHGYGGGKQHGGGRCRAHRGGRCRDRRGRRGPAGAARPGPGRQSAEQPGPRSVSRNTAATTRRRAALRCRRGAGLADRAAARWPIARRPVRRDRRLRRDSRQHQPGHPSDGDGGILDAGRPRCRRQSRVPDRKGLDAAGAEVERRAGGPDLLGLAQSEWLHFVDFGRSIRRPVHPDRGRSDPAGAVVPRRRRDRPQRGITAAVRSRCDRCADRVDQRGSANHRCDLHPGAARARTHPGNRPELYAVQRHARRGPGLEQDAHAERDRGGPLHPPLRNGSRPGGLLAIRGGERPDGLRLVAQRQPRLAGRRPDAASGRRDGGRAALRRCGRFRHLAEPA